MWYLVNKLMTAARGGTREVLEQAVDVNALRILGQEIYQSEALLREAKNHLAKVMAEKLQAQRQLEILKGKISQKEQVIRDHLQAQRESEALALAQTLAALEAQAQQRQTQVDQLQQYEERLLQQVKDAAQQLDHYRSSLSMAKATQHAQAVTQKLHGTTQLQTDQFGAMQETLERIERKQQLEADRLSAQQTIHHYLHDEPTIVQQRQQQALLILERLKAA
ncbi:PspA/IM30 family protein [Thiolinea disciformis]|uniref:PspA/IM30 family protein n=1 Tax=Thiolinea disciformis TaxID=125614 RepID=UPI0003764858|nr:PspA/IM30 family protein [Thiolinea disciformis]